MIITNSIETALKMIISSPQLHARWINTLSCMENCGARKISRCEHPTLVKEEMLKHAAEEFRHAYYLKQQIKKITDENFDSYRLDKILGGMASWHYLEALDLAACRFLKEKFQLSKSEIRKIAYLAVTYAIEVRASILYPLYERILRELDSPIRVKSIVLEEEEHLKDMERELESVPNGLYYCQYISSIESQLFLKWEESINRSIKILS